MNNILGLIGLAKRAGKLALGEEMCSIAVRDRKARAIFTASDASSRAISWAESCGTPHLPLPITKAELGALFSRASCAQFVILDLGIAASIAEKLALSSDSYKKVSDILSEQNARAKKRKAKKQSRKAI